MAADAPMLFAPADSQQFAAQVAAALELPLAALEERTFEDGEHKIRPLEDVRGRDVYIIQSLYGDDAQSPNDKLCRVLFLVGALKDADAARVTLVAPYLCYARKERRTKSRDPVTTRYVAQMMEAVGVDRLVVLEAHNPAGIDNAFRGPKTLLDTSALFVAPLAAALDRQAVTVVSPDAGGVKRAEAFRQALGHRLGGDIGAAFIEKYRSGGVVSGGAVVGPVKDRVALIVDDLISTGTTMARGARACLEQGASQVLAVAAHGLFIPPASEVMADPAIAHIWISDSVPPFRLSPQVRRDKLSVVPSATLFALIISELHRGA